MTRGVPGATTRHEGHDPADKGYGPQRLQILGKPGSSSRGAPLSISERRERLVSGHPPASESRAEGLRRWLQGVLG